MTRKTIKKPDWFHLSNYDKDLSPEKWLNEISTRVSLISKLSTPRPHEEAKNIFLESIKGKNKTKLSETLRPHPHSPIKPITVIDILRMNKLITSNLKYKNHPQKKQIEEIVDALINNKELSPQQKTFYEAFMDTPWYEYESNGNPFTYLKYMSGTPMSINFNVERSTLVSELKKQLNSHIEHKKLNKKMPPISPNLFKEWKEKNVLAVFDLIVWFDICGVSLDGHKAKISKLIWAVTPNASGQKDAPADPAEYLDIAIALSQKVVNHATMNGLLIYCESNAWAKKGKNK